MSLDFMAAVAPTRKVFGAVDPNSLHQRSNNGNKKSTTIDPAIQNTPQVILQQDPAAVVEEIPATPHKLLEQEALAMDWKDAQQNIDHLFEDCLKAQFKGVPKISMPNILRKNGVSLFEHQVDGIRWLTHREKTNTTPAPFYAERKFGSKVLWSDKIQSGRVNYDEKPEPVKGSILADE